MEKTVRFESPMWQAGFTMVPNVILFEETLSASSVRLYAALCKFAWDDDVVWPGQAKLGEMLGIKERAVRTSMRELEARGLVETVRRGLGKTNLYVLHEPNWANQMGKFELLEREEAAAERQRKTGQERQSSPDKVDAGEEDATDGPADTSGSSENGTAPSRTRKSLDVNRKRMTEHEWEIVRQVFAAWARCTGIVFTSKDTDQVKKVVMCIRRSPEVTAEEHVAIVERNCANPWWKDEPDSIGVIYGPRVWAKAQRETGRPTGERARRATAAATMSLLDQMERGEI